MTSVSSRASPAAIASPSSLDAAARLLEFDRERRRPALRARRRPHQPLDLRGERAGALDQRRMGGAGFGGAAAQLVRRLTRLEQPPLRGGQPLVGLTLLLVEPDNRGARLVLAAIELIALLLGLTALARELLALLRQPRRLRRSRAAAARRDRRPPFPACDARRSAPQSPSRPARSSPRARWSPAARRASASRSVAIRSRSSLISRLVSRMPRDSASPPPDTRCGPRKTSPSMRRDRKRASTGWQRSPPSYDGAIQASPIARRMASAKRSVDANDRRQRDDARRHRRRSARHRDTEVRT